LNRVELKVDTHQAGSRLLVSKQEIALMGMISLTVGNNILQLRCTRTAFPESGQVGPVLTATG